MSRRKKPPMIWQEHHDEGAFRSTWTSQANPDLFNTTGNEISAPGNKRPNARKDSVRDHGAKGYVISDYKMLPKERLEDGECNNNESSGTVMKPPTAIGPAAKDDMNLDDTVPPDANLDMGTSKTVMVISTTTDRSTQTPPVTQSTTEQSFATNVVRRAVDSIVPRKR